MTNIDSRLRQQCSKLCNIVVGVLSLAPCYVGKSRYVELIRLHISRGIALFVGQPAMLTRLLPCCLTKSTESKFYIYTDETHTQTPVGILSNNYLTYYLPIFSCLISPDLTSPHRIYLILLTHVPAQSTLFVFSSLFLYLFMYFYVYLSISISLYLYNLN